MRTRFPALALLSALCLASAGCRDREVTAYRVPKEKEASAPETAAQAAQPAPSTPNAPAASAPVASAPATMANTAVPTAQGADLIWTAPSHWVVKPASAMRKGSYAVPVQGGTPADLSITAFPGDVGGEAANLNRWRGQIQLPPSSEAELASAVTRFEQGGLKFAVVDFDNGQTRVLGAIVPVRGSTWFFKLTGPAAAIAQEKPAFLAFLKTVKAPAAP
jgi:hypothetical protein